MDPLGTFLFLGARVQQKPHLSEVILRCDEETGKNRGVGFVVMSSMEGATKAIEELNGQELEGKPLNVAFSERRGRGERADGSTAKGKPGGTRRKKAGR